MTEFIHPSVSSKITDNSFVYQTADGATALFQCIVSEKGPENTLKLVTTPQEFLFHFGTPNVSKYGQAGFNVLEWLKVGGVAYVLRVLPDNATYAVSGLAINIDTSELGAAHTVYPSIFDAKTATIPNSNHTLFAQALKDETTPFVEGSVVASASYPLYVFYPYGKGAAYNTLGVRISLRDDLDQTYAFRTYNFEVTAKDALNNDVVVDGPFAVSLDPEAISNSRESMYLPKVVNKYSKFIKVVDNAANYEAVSTVLADLLAGTDTTLEIDPAEIDLVFGSVKAGGTAAGTGNITQWANEGYVPQAGKIMTSSPLYLNSGSEGTWVDANTEEALLVKAYTGITAPNITDKLAYEFDVLLDANYAIPVKNAMHELASEIRGDCVAMLDVGFQANEAQTLAVRKDSLTMSSRNVAIFAQDMTVYDAYNGQDIKVTSPYVLAGKIPFNDINYGVQWTFVGPRRGVVDGVSNVNFFPNPIWKDNFYKAQINYIEKDPKKMNFATQLTSQVQNSALSDINNVRVILRIQREVEKMMSDYRMEFNDNITHDAMNYDLNNYLQKWVANRACKTISGSVYASDYDRQQKKVNVKIELVFTGIIERVFIDIIVNK